MNGGMLLNFTGVVIDQYLKHGLVVFHKTLADFLEIFPESYFSGDKTKTEIYAKHLVLTFIVKFGLQSNRYLRHRPSNFLMDIMINDKIAVLNDESHHAWQVFATDIEIIIVE